MVVIESLRILVEYCFARLIAEVVSFVHVFRFQCCCFLIHVHSANWILNHAHLHLHHFLVCSFSFSNLKADNFNNAELETTVSELMAIAPAANIGFINPTAATGIITVLYMNAQNRLELIFVIVFLLNSTASAT